ncbi:MAG: GNAT family N-acetyltransferase [Rubrobacter sp.]|nr:GNAT family N-acetyltransferase [Rubrobacter sp.]
METTFARRAVLVTEWRIASAGGEVFELPYGVATRDCEWPGQSLSHLAIVADTRAFDPEHPMPCRHRYEFVVPAPDGFHLEVPGEIRRSIAMNMPLPAEPPGSEELELDRVEDEAGWSRMARMRVEVESAFGVEPERARRMVDHIRRRKRFLDGEWHLALSNDGIVIGGIGLVVFETPSGRLGRLQDVDILPRFQGRGFGNELIAAVVREDRRSGYSSICLRADADDWPKKWYARLGFTPVEEWLRFHKPEGS